MCKVYHKNYANCNRSQDEKSRRNNYEQSQAIVKKMDSHSDVLISDVTKGSAPKTLTPTQYSNN